MFPLRLEYALIRGLNVVSRSPNIAVGNLQTEASDQL